MTHDLYIVQGGYMHFDMGIVSDYRCIWIDIRTRVLMRQDLKHCLGILQHNGSNATNQELGINTLSTTNNIQRRNNSILGSAR
jgi:hypothetical protein